MRAYVGAETTGPDADGLPEVQIAVLESATAEAEGGDKKETTKVTNEWTPAQRPTTFSN